MRSGIYEGFVRHERLRPRRHRLRYRVFSLLLDLDELAELDRRFWPFGVGRPSLIGFRAADHGDGVTPLRTWVVERLRAGGIRSAVNRIELLCYPRLFGFVFNPLSVYFCRDHKDNLVGVVCEVHNTHGERHTYVLPVAAGQAIVRHTEPKAFFVSPFVPMDCTYRFRIAPADQKVGISILEDDAAGLLLTASFNGERREISSGALAGLLLRYPLMTLKVVAGIHWEALKLLAKGIRFLHWQPAMVEAQGAVGALERQPRLPIVDASVSVD
jgi:DUF1365 family protein